MQRSAFWRSSCFLLRPCSRAFRFSLVHSCHLPAFRYFSASSSSSFSSSSSLSSPVPSASSSAVALHFAEAATLTAGAPSPPIIILHGLLGSVANWRSIVRTLGSQRRIFSLDLRNHGASPHADSMTLEDMVSDVVKFLQDHKISKCVLLGHSLGGRVAMLLALRYPSLIDKLVVADIAPVSGTFDETKAIVDTLTTLDLSKAKTRVDVDQMLKPKFESLSLRQFLLQNITIAEDGSLRWRVNLPAIVKNMPKFSKFEFDNQPFRGEVLFLKGQTSDYLVWEKHQKAIERYFPTAKRVTISKASHWLHADNPTEFIEAVNNFISPPTQPQ